MPKEKIEAYYISKKKSEVISFTICLKSKNNNIQIKARIKAITCSKTVTILATNKSLSNKLISKYFFYLLYFLFAMLKYLNSTV